MPLKNPYLRMIPSGALALPPSPLTTLTPPGPRPRAANYDTPPKESWQKGKALRSSRSSCHPYSQADFPVCKAHVRAVGIPRPPGPPPSCTIPSPMPNFSKSQIPTAKEEPVEDEPVRQQLRGKPPRHPPGGIMDWCEHENSFI